MLIPGSQIIKKKGESKQRRLFTDDDGNSRASLGMDEGESLLISLSLVPYLSSNPSDSNMSNVSTASDSNDGFTQLTTKTEEKVSQLETSLSSELGSEMEQRCPGGSQENDDGVCRRRSLHWGDQHGGEETGEGRVHLA